MYMYRHTSSAAVFSNKHLNVQILSISLKVASWVYQAVSQPGMSVLYERRKLHVQCSRVMKDYYALCRWRSWSKGPKSGEMINGLITYLTVENQSHTSCLYWWFMLAGSTRRNWAVNHTMTWWRELIRAHLPKGIHAWYGIRVYMHASSSTLYTWQPVLTVGKFIVIHKKTIWISAILLHKILCLPLQFIAASWW